MQHTVINDLLLEVEKGPLYAVFIVDWNYRNAWSIKIIAGKPRLRTSGHRKPRDGCGSLNWIPIKMMKSNNMMAMTPSVCCLTTPCVYPMTDQQAEKSRLPQGFNSTISLLLIQSTKLLSAHSPFHWTGPVQADSLHFLCFYSLQHTSMLQLRGTLALCFLSTAVAAGSLSWFCILFSERLCLHIYQLPHLSDLWNLFLN